jgi:hypothetical protein
MSERWPLQDAFGRSYTVVSRSSHRADEQSRRLPENETNRVIDSVFNASSDRDPFKRATLIALADVSRSDGQRYPRQALVDRVKRRVGPAGPLMVIADAGHLTASAPSDQVSSEKRLADAIMKGRSSFAFESRRYQVVPAAAAVVDHDYQVLGVDEARVVLARLQGRPGTTAADQQALSDARNVIVTRTSVPPTSGLFLLRYVPDRSYREEEVSASTSTPSRLVKKAIQVTFLEIGTQRPLSGTAFMVEKPDGSQGRETTSSAGLISIDGLDPGACQFTSLINGATLATSYSVAAGNPPADGDSDEDDDDDADADKSPIKNALVVSAEAYHVKTGDTPDSIAAKSGVDWNAIAQFNFETTDPDQLETYYRDRVGCTNQTPDGKKYVFDDEDDPGVILIPRAWESSFAVGDTYTVWVEPQRTIFISLENEDELALPGAAYQVDFEDGSTRQGQLGSSGIARVTGVPDGPFAVSYPDRDDLLARSIAASMRQAFDQQDTGPLFFMLGQSPDVVQQTVAVYEQYFNDLSGDGLAADIDQVVTDDDARPPLVFLCALAGIPIDGTDGAIIQDGSPAVSDDG